MIIDEREAQMRKRDKLSERTSTDEREKKITNAV